MASLAEINGLIADMLAEPSLPIHVVSGLKAVSQLLCLSSYSTATFPNFINGPMVPLAELIGNGKDILLISKKYQRQINLLRRNLSNDISEESKVNLTDDHLLMSRQIYKKNGFPVKLKSFSSFSLIQNPNPEKRPLRRQKTVYDFYPQNIIDAQKNNEDLNNENEQFVQLEDGIRFDLNFMKTHSEYWKETQKWDFPIFDACSVSDGCILSQMCYGIFQTVGYLESFNLSNYEFLSYFRALESGYRNIPYHNRTHAADVVHGVYYLTTQAIPDTRQPTQLSTEKPNDKSANADNEKNYWTIGSHFSQLELMALYVAAAMHDCDHPGRTNAFLVSTHAPQAVMYNDRSVLENHHAATGWNLLYSKPSYNFLKNLDATEFKRFRFLVIELILATDLQKHFEIIGEFNTKFKEDNLDWKNESDRLLIMKMCIKLSDVNGPCKERKLHFQWTQRITEEFYEQGDEEVRLGLPISPFMDRKNPQLAKSQDAFIKFIVTPLCSAYDNLGLLPGEWIETKNSEGVKSDSELHQNSKYQKECPLSKNLKDNHDYWMNVLQQETEVTSGIK